MIYENNLKPIRRYLAIYSIKKLKGLENMIFIINPDRTNPFDVFDLLMYYEQLVVKTYKMSS